MKMQTAINQIKKECEFQGLTFVQVLEDIQKYGRMMYSEKTMDAYQTVIFNGQFFDQSPIDIALYNKDMMEME
jgi:pyruvate/2-oxoacid:ferredoxin oxidoreductase beta subunit